ncbi:MAG: hypothetical protein ACFBWO_06230 [Paracoccaceae bacterium]
MHLRHIATLILVALALPASAQDGAAEETFTLGPAVSEVGSVSSFGLAAGASRPSVAISALRSLDDARLAERRRPCPFSARTMLGDELSPGMRLTLDTHEGRLALLQSQGAINDYVSGGIDTRPCG